METDKVFETFYFNTINLSVAKKKKILVGSTALRVSSQQRTEFLRSKYAVNLFGGKIENIDYFQWFSSPSIEVKTLKLTNVSSFGYHLRNFQVSSTSGISLKF